MRPTPEPPIRFGGGTLRFPTLNPDAPVHCGRCGDLKHVAVDGNVYPCPDCAPDACLGALRRRVKTRHRDVARFQ